MNATQMKREIDKLKAANAAGELGEGAAKRLRQMERALPDLLVEEQRKTKLASYGDAPREHHPIDDGLTGAAWVNFYNTYCDPKGLAPATLSDSPELIRDHLRKLFVDAGTALDVPAY